MSRMLSQKLSMLDVYATDACSFFFQILGEANVKFDQPPLWISVHDPQGIETVVRERSIHHQLITIIHLYSAIKLG